MTDQPTEQQRLWQYVETWRSACADLVTLARELPEHEWSRPTDLAGWDVKDNVAHTAHLETVLAGGPEDTVQITTAAHVRNSIGIYTERGVVARRGRTMAELADEIEQAVARRYDELRADPPADGAAPPARTFAGVDWDTERLLKNRPLDVWMHTQDIRRATGRPGGYDAPAARHTIDYLADSFAVVVGKRVAPPAGTAAALEVPEAGVRRCVEVGDDARARPTDRTPDVRLVMSPETFVVLAGGRRSPDQVAVRVDGDRELGGWILDQLAVTP
jgi:uncharacterized protein (TIGR03083 family)